MAEVYIDSTPQLLNANTTAFVAWPVGRYITGTVQIQPQDGTTWNTAVVEIKRSLDGYTWYPFPEPVLLGADGITVGLDLTGTAYIAAVVTTIEGGALELNCYGCFKT